MVDKHSITTPIEAIVDDKLEKLAYPTKVTITKVYNNGYVDVENDTYGELKYIPTIVPHNIGDVTVLIFCDNNYGDRIII